MRTFGIPFPVFDKADGGSGGGGGASGKADDPAKSFTEEQQSEIGKIVNAAVTSHLKRSLGTAVKEAVGELKIGETIAAEVAKMKPAEPEPKPEKDKPDPKIAALQAKVDELTTKLTNEAAEREKAVAAARDKDALASLKTALAPHVRPEALEIAASHLFVAQKRISFDDKGNPVLSVRKAAFAGGDEEDVAMPLADGVQHWVKSAEGKFFAPAPGGGADPKGGLGPRRVNTGADGMPRYDAPATTDSEKIRRATEREAALRAKYPDIR